MNYNTITGAAATMALFVPILLVIIFRLFKNISLFALLLSYLLIAIYNLMVFHLLPVSDATTRTFGIVSNYLDAPLMLVVMLFFCFDNFWKKIIYGMLAAFVVFELVVMFYLRFNLQSSTLILGPGTIIILLLSIYFFIHHGKMTIIQGKSTGKTFMTVSLLFSYGCFVVIYFLHYIQKTSAVEDVFLIFYIVTFVSAVLMSVGLVCIYKRIRQIAELQVARKELALFFNN